MAILNQFICECQSDIPQEALIHLDNGLVNRLGSPFSSLFPEFSAKFSMASREIDANWELPKLALRQFSKGWIGSIYHKSNRGFLLFKLQPEFVEKEGDYFDEIHEMLPNEWKELYRFFDSFVISDNCFCPAGWQNTPFTYGARLDLDDYIEICGVSRKQTTEFAKRISCRREHLKCWLLTENEDALFIDEQHCDHKVYHVRGKLLDDIYVLPDPHKTLDAYLAHFLSGGKPADFDFRAPVA